VINTRVTNTIIVILGQEVMLEVEEARGELGRRSVAEVRDVAREDAGHITRLDSA